MPPRGRKRRGKELVAAVATDAPGDAAAAVSPEYVEAVVAELEHESERRVKKLKRQMGDMRQEFLNHFQVELLKIPRKIREMKVEHFSSEYGGSMEEALKSMQIDLAEQMEDDEQVDEQDGEARLSEEERAIDRGYIVRQQGPKLGSQCACCD